MTSNPLLRAKSVYSSGGGGSPPTLTFIFPTLADADAAHNWALKVLRGEVETPAPHHYAYGIVDKQNKPHFSEACVGERIDMENEAESLNDGDRRDDYRVVELLWRDSPEKAAAECTLPHDHFGACNAEKTSRKGLCREGFCSPDKPCVLPAGHRGPHEFTPVKCPNIGGYECPKGAECKC